MSNLKTPKSEYLLKKQSKFVTKYGTSMDIEKPKVVYLRTKSKITPIVKQREYNVNIQNVKDGFGGYVKRTLRGRKEVGSDFLYNLEISEKSVKFGKVSFLRCDVYLKPLEKKTLIQHKEMMEQISMMLDEGLESILMENQIKCV